MSVVDVVGLIKPELMELQENVRILRFGKEEGLSLVKTAQVADQSLNDGVQSGRADGALRSAAYQLRDLVEVALHLVKRLQTPDKFLKTCSTAGQFRSQVAEIENRMMASVVVNGLAKSIEITSYIRTLKLSHKRDTSVLKQELRVLISEGVGKLQEDMNRFFDSSSNPDGFENWYVHSSELEVFTQRIGAGRQGSLWMGRYRGEAVAVKDFYLNSRKDLDRFRAEVSIATRSIHPNIVLSIGAWYPTKPQSRIFDKEDSLTHPPLPGRQPAKLLMEPLRHGDLLSAIPRLNITKKGEIVKDIIRGVSYLHDCKILHRDLKPQNILLTKEDEAKVGDFWLSKQLIGSTAWMPTRVGNSVYLAPELVHHGAKHTFSSDIFSVGALVFHLYSGRSPTEVEGNGSDESAHSEISNSVVGTDRRRFPTEQMGTAPEWARWLVDCCTRSRAEERPPLWVVRQVVESGLQGGEFSVSLPLIVTPLARTLTSIATDISQDTLVSLTSTSSLDGAMKSMDFESAFDDEDNPSYALFSYSELLRRLQEFGVFEMRERLNLLVARYRQSPAMKPEVLEQLDLVVHALELSQPALLKHSSATQLATQLYGRLAPVAESRSLIQRLLKSVEMKVPLPWIKPWTNETGLFVPQGPLRMSLTNERYWVRSMACLGNGLVVVAGDLTGTLQVWDIEMGQRWKEFRARSMNELSVNPVRSVTSMNDGRRVLCGCADSKIKLMDVDTGRCLKTLVGHRQGVISTALVGDGAHMVSGGIDSTINVWHLESGKCRRTLKSLSSHTHWVSALSELGDGRRVISGSFDKTVKIWDTDKGKCLSTLFGHNDAVNSVGAVAYGVQIVSGSEDRSMKVWDTETGRCFRTFNDPTYGHTDGVTQVVGVGDGRRALSASRDKTIKLWDCDTSRPVLTFNGHVGEVLSIAVLEDGRRFISGSSDGTIKVWDTRCASRSLAVVPLGEPTLMDQYARLSRKSSGLITNFKSRIGLVGREEPKLIRNTKPIVNRAIDGSPERRSTGLRDSNLRSSERAWTIDQLLEEAEACLDVSMLGGERVTENTSNGQQVSIRSDLGSVKFIVVEYR